MPRLRSLPEQAVMRDLYRTHPGTCKPLGELTEAAMRGPSPFTQAQRELIAAYVSGLNACTYCYGTHAGVAEACGVAPDCGRRWKATDAPIPSVPEGNRERVRSTLCRPSRSAL